MRSILKDRVDQYCSALVTYEMGDELTAKPGGHVDQENPEVVVVKEHFAWHLSGVFLCQYDRGRGSYVVNGRTNKGIHPVTGRKDRYPNGTYTNKCISPEGGSIFYLVQKYPNEPLLDDPLDFFHLFKGDQISSVPERAKVVLFEGDDAFLIKPAPAESFSMPEDGVVFWTL